jgi:hypothetical protein
MVGKRVETLARQPVGNLERRRAWFAGLWANATEPSFCLGMENA